jgi:hypothetical protein
VADIGEEKALGDGDVCGVLVGGGVGGALIGVPLPVTLQHKPPYSNASAATHDFMRCKKLAGNT